MATDLEISPGRKLSALAMNPKMQDIQTFLQDSIGELMPFCTAIKPEQMIVLAILLAYRNPDLQKCDKPTILASMIQAASFGFDLTPSAGEAWLIPRWNKDTGSHECQFQPGFQGLVKLVRQTGQIDYIQARSIYERDAFEYWYDPELQFKHRPSLDGDRGAITHVYCVTKLLTGSRLIRVLTHAEVEAIRACSTQKTGAIWNRHWEEMAYKTVLKKMTKTLDKTPKLIQAIEIDNQDYDFDAIDGPKEHHAALNNNNTGHGSGAYAKPADVQGYTEWLSAFVSMRNMEWLDTKTGKHGELPKGLSELTNTHQLGGHLYKFGRDTKEFTAPDEPRGTQRNKFTAIWWTKDKGAVEDEARSYCKTLWGAATKKLKEAIEAAEPKPEDESQEPVIDVEAGDDWADHEDAMAREQAATA